VAGVICQALPSASKLAGPVTRSEGSSVVVTDAVYQGLTLVHSSAQRKHFL